MEAPLVSICCLTYNHALYIRQCLDGFLMQKTSFNYEILIHDDASTDSTASIIREYEQRFPDVIKPIYQTVNQHSLGVKISTTFQFPRVKGKYIAMCEGDDYWTDPYKLQHQVDFLENNSDFSICSHRFKVFDQENSINSDDDLGYLFKNTEDGIIFNLKDNFKKKWLTKTLTTVFRTESIKQYMEESYNIKRDTVLFYYVLKSGKGYCFNNYWGVYRKHLGGVCSKVSPSAKFKVGYLTYMELFKHEHEKWLRNRASNEFCNYFVTSFPHINKLNTKVSWYDYFCLFYFIPLKIVKRIKMVLFN